MSPMENERLFFGAKTPDNMIQTKEIRKIRLIILPKVGQECALICGVSRGGWSDLHPGHPGFPSTALEFGCSVLIPVLRPQYIG